MKEATEFWFYSQRHLLQT